MFSTAVSRLPVTIRSTLNQLRHPMPSLYSTIRRQPQRSFLALVNLELIKNILFILFLFRWAKRAFWQLRGRGIFGSLIELYHYIRRILYGYFLRLPMVRNKVRRQVDESIASIQQKLIPAHTIRYLTLPKDGMTDAQVRDELAALAALEHTRWEDGLVSGAVYSGEVGLLALQTDAFGKFTVSNPIHPDVFPGVRKMEAEIVAMVLAMFNAPSGAAGVTTSGGTESILMACLSARQKARAERGVTEPEMIIPDTAHTAFHKAGAYFGIKVHKVPCPAPDYQVDVARVRRLINPNTVLLVASAPNFPHGIIDDVASLSTLALRYKLLLHVDCCLGSFLVPFLEQAGFESQMFDFRLKGVTSISCDTHKYGFAPKGSSTVLYRTKALRTFQYFVSPDWSGGVYASPGIAGSRPGALIAGCWASMMRVGEKGYISACREIVGAAKNIARAFSASSSFPALASELELIGRPLVSVVAFRARTTAAATDVGAFAGGGATRKPLNIYDVADGMGRRGWHLNALQSPPAIHIAVTLPVAKVWEKLLTDLEAVVEEERERQRERVVRGLESGVASGTDSSGDTAALYGVAGSLPNKSVVVELANGFLDTLYKA